MVKKYLIDFSILFAIIFLIFIIYYVFSTRLLNTENIDIELLEHTILSDLNVDPGALKFSIDSSLIYADTKDKELYVWQSSDGKLVKKLKGIDTFNGPFISDDNKRMAVGNYKVLTVFETDNWSVKYKLNWDGDYNKFFGYFLPDHSLMFYRDCEGKNDDYWCLFKIDDDGNQQKLAMSDKKTHPFPRFILSPDKKHLAVSSGYALYIFDTFTLKSTYIIECETIKSFNFTPDSQHIILFHMEPEYFQVLEIHNLSTKKLINKKNIFLTTTTNSITFLPDGNLFASADKGEFFIVEMIRAFLTGTTKNSINFWDFRTGNRIFTIPAEDETRRTWITPFVQFSPNGKYLLINSSQNGLVKLFKVKKK